MPFFTLQIKANLTNIESLSPDCNESFRWQIKTSCSNCRQQDDQWKYIVFEDIEEGPKGRSECHLIEKCSLCGRQNTLEIIPNSFGKYSSEKNGQFQDMLQLDCRGMEPVAFDFRNNWVAVGEGSNTKFEDVDLSSDIWCDYDEKSGESVEIGEYEARFVVSKKK
uniref:DUF866-domain-containing protein n=1 Tax=Rhabditophanes sp. KR3021 TaxID=114890 RepID=A0AC35UDB2_9BILA